MMEATSTTERPAAPTAPAQGANSQRPTAQELKARETKLQEDFLAAELRRLDRELTAANSVVQGPPGGIERRATPRPATIRLPNTPIKLDLKKHKRSGLLGLVRRLWRGDDIAMRRPY